MTTKTKQTAHLEVRSQKSVGSSYGKFGGPDTYVAVQIVPDGEVPLRALNHTFAAQRGIEIRWIGEGYAEHTGPRSSLGRAIKAAQALVDEINERNES